MGNDMLFDMCFCIVRYEKSLLLVKGEKVELPHVPLQKQIIPFFPDYIPMINSYIQNTYGIRCIVLRHLREEKNNLHYCELELIECKKDNYLMPINIHRLLKEKWRYPSQKKIILLWMKSNLLGRWEAWEKYNWYFKTSNMIEEQFKELNIVVRKIEQYKGAWGWSSIIKICTNEKLFYFKANYPFKPAEIFTINILRNISSSNVPTTIRFDEKNNWLIMEDFGIRRLENLEQIKKAIYIYATYQIQYWKRYYNHTCNFYKKMSAKELNRIFRKVVIRNQRWIRNQSINEELLLSWVNEKCLELSKYEKLVPYTIHNEDFREGNVAVQGDNIILYDWSKTVISIPFFSIVYFIRKSTMLENEEIKKTYLNVWNEYIDGRVCNRLMEVVENLYYVYEADRCLLDLNLLKKGSPWYINSAEYIKKCLHKISQQILKKDKNNVKL